MVILFLLDGMIFRNVWMGYFILIMDGMTFVFLRETHQNVFAVQCLRPRMAFCHPNVEVHYLQCVNGTSSGEQVFGNDGKFHRPLTFTPRPHELLGVPGRETLV
jgi:hypothetical protein